MKFIKTITFVYALLVMIFMMVGSAVLLSDPNTCGELCKMLATSLVLLFVSCVIIIIMVIALIQSEDQLYYKK